MTADSPQPQITVLDAGGQYCHLIARRVREFGIYAEVRPSETPAAELASRKGIIISGGPNSVYEPGAPTADAAIFALNIPILGICYGQQLMAYLMNGYVRKGDIGEYGHAYATINDRSAIFEGVTGREQVWMSHRDQVERVPAGFSVLASTTTCPVAAIGDHQRRLYGLQFHPEVVHTPSGGQILSNFLFGVCGCRKDWDPRGRIALLEQRIREVAGNRNVFFFVSGGVDSSVAYRLTVQALGRDRVHGAYVDTGLMREGETDFVRQALDVTVVDAREEFLGALEGVVEPEQKRHIIGEQFVAVQNRVLNSGHYLDGDWILGQGTIYPDTIESGGTARADIIKTHHNRVAGIQKLIDEGRIIEPLTSFYKDEVRELGRELGLPEELLDRHPFPGPGLAIRLLCASQTEEIQKIDEGWLVPVHSVGVQGDSRSYRPVIAIEGKLDLEHSTELINRERRANRVVGVIDQHAPICEQRVWEAHLTGPRLDRLRQADAIVRKLSHDSGFDRQVWQFPVIVVPVGTPARPDSVVLRPIHSVDGMTAQVVVMAEDLLAEIARRLLQVEGLCTIFYDLTHKPPGTIEWE
ncbi:MAG: glutamine-hydrolyzing GMP synthase [Bryobacterales bacterium]|nr:glutamine-hydrolyzing GMP synthase [Bryobacterales bacterium]